ncbi:MAG: LuxR C-terminal-related transcriptional regulator, partial [Vulcanimicrobiaceae bacterium]
VLQRAGRWEDADAQLRAGYESARRNGDDRTACVALLERGVALGTFRFRMHGDHSESEACFREALILADGPSLRDRPNFRQLSCEVLGLVRALRFEYDEAFRWFAEAERLELAASSHAELVFVEIARVYGWMGDWHRSLEYAELAEELFRADYPFHIGYALLVVSKALIMLGEERERAIASCREAVEALRSSYEDEELGVAYAVLAEALFASDDPDLADVIEACEAAERFVDARNVPTRCEIALLRAKVALRGGDEPAWADATRRAMRLAQGDRWLTARIELERAWVACMHGDERTALDGFDLALARFGEIRDRYHHAIARVGRDALLARAGTLDEGEARALLTELTSQGVVYAALRYEPPARDIFHWCLRNGMDVRGVQSLYERLHSIDADELASIARDAQAAPAGRAGALRLLGARASAGADSRPLLRELSGDPQAQVAAAAANLLETLPEYSVPPLRISVIAGLCVSSQDGDIQEGDTRWGRRKAAELLRLLAVAGAPLTKGAVLQALWPDAYKGREVTMRVVIHALRRALEPASENSSEYVVYDGTTISLRRSNVEWIDSECALGDIQRGKHFVSVGAFDVAEPLLVHACELLASAPKEDGAPVWLQPHVRGWRAATLDGLRSLASVYFVQQRHDDALATVRRALSLDALDEGTVCLALELLTSSGAFGEGHALYAAYKRRLADTFGAAPGAEVVERYSRLLSGRSERKRTELSNRETEILRLVARGQTSKEIAHRLALSVFTINNHVGRILKKLGVESRAAAVAYLHANEDFTP